MAMQAVDGVWWSYMGRIRGERIGETDYLFDASGMSAVEVATGFAEAEVRDCDEDVTFTIAPCRFCRGAVITFADESGAVVGTVDIVNEGV